MAVLEGIVDTTNVGAIFRSAAALHMDAVLLSPTCCDPLNRRAVRVSMGTVFQIPWTRLGENHTQWPETGLRRLHDLGFETAAMALSDTAVSHRRPQAQGRPAPGVTWAPRGTGWPTRPLQAVTTRSVSPCPTAWTP